MNLILALVLLCIGHVTSYLAPYKRDVHHVHGQMETVPEDDRQWQHGNNGQTQDGRQCSHQFCINKDYKKLELPPPNNGSVVQVVITPHILEIFEVGRFGQREQKMCYYPISYYPLNVFDKLRRTTF